MLKAATAVVIAMLASLSFADNSSLNLQLPSAPGSYATDSFRAGDLDCKNAIGGGSTFELGATGIINNAVSPFGSEDSANPQTKDIGLYARIVIPIDGPKQRINCNSLFELELQARRLEVMRLQQELENLKKLQGGFEN